MPKIVDHDRYRRELLIKSFDLFAEKGYGSVTMRQIAQELKVSTGTLYHYFPNKKALFELLAEEIAKQDISMGITAIEGKQTRQEKFAALGEYLAANEDYFIKWTHVLIDFRKHKDSQEIQNSESMTRTNERYQKATIKIFEIEDPALITFIFAFIDGLILEKIYNLEEISFQDQCALLGKMIDAYLEKEKD